MSSPFIARVLFKGDVEDAEDVEDPTSRCIIEEINRECETNSKIGGEGTRCIGCGTLIVHFFDNKRERFYCGVDCIGVTASHRLNADAFITHYSSPIASAVRIKSLPIYGMQVILSYLYNKHLGAADMETKWNQIQHSVLFKRKLIIDK